MFASKIRNEHVIMVFNMSLNEIAEAVDGTLVGAGAIAHGISTDTRTLMRDDLFVALKGENYDGHDYIGSAMSRGAVGYLVDREVPGVEPLIIVEDTKKALGKLAAFWRLKFTVPVIAITGSNGKTTVKEMIASIFRQRGEVLYTPGNFNNDIGLPLTLLSINSHHEFAVIEMGANHMDEIAYLCKITHPDIAVVTNAGPAHLEGFGSLDNVAKAKGELFANIKQDSVSVINNDDQYKSLWLKLTKSKRKITFGCTETADVYFDNLKMNDSSDFTIHFPDHVSFDVGLKLLGEHNVRNAVAAAAVAYAYGIAPEEIKNGLEEMQPVSGRLLRSEGLNHSIIIDDTYNANPASVKAALNVLKHCQGERIFVLGDLGELGDESIKLHEDISIAANQSGVDMLFTLGELSKHTAKLFAGLSYSYMSLEELLAELKKHVDRNTFVLVKGSRFMHMELVVKALTNVAGE